MGQNFGAGSKFNVFGTTTLRGVYRIDCDEENQRFKFWKKWLPQGGSGGGGGGGRQFRKVVGLQRRKCKKSAI